MTSARLPVGRVDGVRRRVRIAVVVAALPIAAALIGRAFATAGPATTPNVDAANDVVAADLDTSGAGWALLDDHRMFSTEDGGRKWAPLNTPFGPDTAAMSGDSVLVAAIQGGADGYQVALGRSDDGGQNWHVSKVAVTGQPGSLSASIVGTQAAILVQQTTGAQFSAADLLVSSGLNVPWSLNPAPIAGRVDVIGPNEIWIAGGAANDQLFRTGDSGKTWMTSPIKWDDQQVTVSPPVATGLLDRQVAVTINGDDSRLLVLVSHDEGASWVKEEDLTTASSTGVGAALAAATLDGVWFVVDQGGMSPQIAISDTLQATTTAIGLPAGVEHLMWAHDGLAWAEVTISGCASGKTACYSRRALMGSFDAGRSWTDLQPGGSQ